MHTGSYADARGAAEIAKRLEALREGARQAVQAGLHVNAGHGLNYRNVQVVAAIPKREELNIGHAIVARSIFVGFREAVREMKALIR